MPHPPVPPSPVPPSSESRPRRRSGTARTLAPASARTLRRGWRRRRALAALAVALGSVSTALAGCGPLAPVVDEALNPTLQAAGTCCHGMDRLRFAELAAATVIDVPAAAGAFANGSHAVRVEAVATTEMLDQQVASTIGWDGDEAISAGDGTHDLVLALVTRTAQPDPSVVSTRISGAPVPGPTAGAGTETGTGAGAGEVFQLHTLDRQTAAGSTHDLTLFGAEPDPRRPASVVIVARVLRGTDIWITSAGATADSPELDLRTGRTIG